MTPPQDTTFYDLLQRAMLSGADPCAVNQFGFNAADVAGLTRPPYQRAAALDKALADAGTTEHGDAAMDKVADAAFGGGGWNSYDYDYGGGSYGYGGGGYGSSYGRDGPAKAGRGADAPSGGETAPSRPAVAKATARGGLQVSSFGWTQLHAAAANNAPKVRSLLAGSHEVFLGARVS